jgi:TetR/AcrR family transcriptional regulator, mexJK operon transcriptional repressor
MAKRVGLPSQIKREHVRAVAQQLFGKSGFAGTSMDAIAATAEVSKPTLYRYYENKEELFADVLRDLTIRRVWSDVPPVTAETAVASRAELARILLALAQSALPHLLDPTYLGLLRVLIAEIPRFPQLADVFRASVLEEGPRVLLAVLDRARAAGVVRLRHPEVASRLFVGPLLSYMLSNGLLNSPVNARPPATEEVATLVDLFITAIT